MKEPSWQIHSTSREDIEKQTDGEALSERIREWLATPVGSVANYPSWGNELFRFKFDPLSKGNDLDVLIEMAIARKLPVDIDDLILLGVDVQVNDIDLCTITILHQFGATVAEASL